MDRRYIPIVNWVSSFAIAIGLASILIVISVMNGFEEEIYKNILKSQPHLVLKNTSDDESDELRCKDFDLSNLVGCKSFSQMNAVVESDSVIQAIEYEMSDWFELNENLFKAIVIEKAVMTGLLFFVVLIGNRFAASSLISFFGGEIKYAYACFDERPTLPLI